MNDFRSISKCYFDTVHVISLRTVIIIIRCCFLPMHGDMHSCCQRQQCDLYDLCECSLTETLSEPLQAELMDVERKISDQIDLNAAIKSNLLAKDEKILKMIRTTRP